MVTLRLSTHTPLLILTTLPLLPFGGIYFLEKLPRACKLRRQLDTCKRKGCKPVCDWKTVQFNWNSFCHLIRQRKGLLHWKLNSILNAYIFPYAKIFKVVLKLEIEFYILIGILSFTKTWSLHFCMRKLHKKVELGKHKPLELTCFIESCFILFA